MRFTRFRPKSWPHRGNSAISEPEMMISSGEIARRYYRQPTFHPSGINVCGRHLHIYRFPDCFFLLSRFPANRRRKPHHRRRTRPSRVLSSTLSKRFAAASVVVVIESYLRFDDRWLIFCCYGFYARFVCIIYLVSSFWITFNIQISTNCDSSISLMIFLLLLLSGYNLDSVVNIVIACDF